MRKQNDGQSLFLPIVLSQNNTFPSTCWLERKREGKQKGCVNYGNDMKRGFLPYNPKLTSMARNLRNNSTLAEVLLWNQLKRKQMRGYDFHRQKPIDGFIVDFFSPKLLLAVEIDGTSHAFRDSQDTARQKQLEYLGIRFLRFDDLDVKFRMDDVLKTIDEWIGQNSHTPSASSGHPSRIAVIRAQRGIVKKL